MKIIYLHNIFWSRYRINLFNAISRSLSPSYSFLVWQVARTERQRVLIGDMPSIEIDHEYNILFDGCYEDIPKLRVFGLLFISLFRLKFDLVIVTGYSSFESWIALFVAKILRKKIFLTIDSSLYEYKPNSRLNFLKKFFVRSSDAVLAYGTSSQEFAGLMKGNLTDIFSPFHCLDQCYYLPKHLVYQMKKSRISNRFDFLYVGRLSNEKAVLDLVYSFAAVFSVNTGVCLRLVGDGPLRSQISDIVINNKFSHIIVEGPKVGNDLMNSYSGANCLVLPSLLEPWGLVVNESLCLGTPVVVSDKCGCVPDLVDGNCNAVKFKAGSVIDLQRALVQAYQRFRIFDDNVIFRCVDLGQQYSVDRAVNTLLIAMKSVYK